MKTLFHFLTAGILATQFFASVFASDVDSASIPFRLLSGHLIVIQGSIGALDQLDFVLDTGAHKSLLSSRIASKLNLKGKSKEVLACHSRKTRVKEVVLPKLRFGAIESISVPAYVKDLSFCGKEVDALVGLDVLKQANFTIDFETKQITFSEALTGDSSVHFPGILPFVMVRMMVQGQPLLLELDTGSSDLMLFKRKVKDKLSMKRTREQKTVKHLAGSSTLKKVILSDVSLGTTQWNDLPAYLTDDAGQASGHVDGLLGISNLGLKRLQFDFESNVLRWVM